MNTRSTSRRVVSVSILMALLAVATLAAQAPDKLKSMELVTLTGKVTALDQATRAITLRGPLGGEVYGTVSPEAKNLAQVKVGDLVTIGFYESLAVTVKRKGEAANLFESASGNVAAEGARPAGYVAKTSTEVVTVVAVDAEKRSLVVQDAKGAVRASAVERPEFAAKLVDLKVGDQLEVTRTEAFVVNVSPAESGAKASVSVTSSTLVVEHGEVVRVMNNTVWVRNEDGRTIKVVTDPKFKFKLNGKDATVADLKPGVKLTKTAFRVVESVQYEAP